MPMTQTAIDYQARFLPTDRVEFSYEPDMRQPMAGMIHSTTDQYCRITIWLPGGSRTVFAWHADDPRVADPFLWAEQHKNYNDAFGVFRISAAEATNKETARRLEELERKFEALEQTQMDLAAKIVSQTPRNTGGSGVADSQQGPNKSSAYATPRRGQSPKVTADA